MDYFESNYITFRELLGPCLSQINLNMLILYYGITLLESEPSSISTLLCLTFDKLKLILEYCG